MLLSLKFYGNGKSILTPSSSAASDPDGKGIRKPIHQSLAAAARQPPLHFIIYMTFPALPTAATKTNSALEQNLFTQLIGAEPQFLFVSGNVRLFAVLQGTEL